DIPPLAFAAAARSGVASIAVGNFTWDWIYSIYPAFEEDAPDVVPTIQRAYRSAELGLRLPFGGGFEQMAAVTTDIPLIARRSARPAGSHRRQAGRPRVVRRVRSRAPDGSLARRHVVRAAVVRPATGRAEISGCDRCGRRRGEQAGIRNRVRLRRQQYPAALH